MYHLQRLTSSGPQNCLAAHRLLICLGCACACCLLSNPRAAADEGPSIATVERARVVALDDAQLPAKETGLLASLHVAEGTNVKKGELLAVVNSSENANRVEILAPFPGVVVKIYHPLSKRL